MRLMYFLINVIILINLMETILTKKLTKSLLRVKKLHNKKSINNMETTLSSINIPLKFQSHDENTIINPNKKNKNQNSNQNSELNSQINEIYKRYENSETQSINQIEDNNSNMFQAVHNINNPTNFKDMSLSNKNFLPNPNSFINNSINLENNYKISTNATNFKDFYQNYYKDYYSNLEKIYTKPYLQENNLEKKDEMNLDNSLQKNLEKNFEEFPITYNLNYNEKILNPKTNLNYINNENSEILVEEGKEGNNNDTIFLPIIQPIINNNSPCVCCEKIKDNVFEESCNGNKGGCNPIPKCNKKCDNNCQKYLNQPKKITNSTNITKNIPNVNNKIPNVMKKFQKELEKTANKTMENGAEPCN